MMTLTLPWAESEILEHLPWPVLAVGPDGTILRVNSTFLRWSGYDRAMIERRPLQDIFPDLGPEAWDTPLPWSQPLSWAEDLTHRRAVQGLWVPWPEGGGWLVLPPLGGKAAHPPETSAVEANLSPTVEALRTLRAALWDDVDSQRWLRALNATTELVRGEWAALYLRQGDTLHLTEHTREAPALPSRLPWDSLTPLDERGLWDVQKPAPTPIHRRARLTATTHVWHTWLRQHPLANEGILWVGFRGWPDAEQRVLLDLVAELWLWRFRPPRADSLRSELLDYALEAVVVLDEHARIRGWNRTAENLFQYQATEVQGRQVADILVGPKALDESLKRAQQEGQPVTLDGWLFVRRDGEPLPCRVRIVPMSVLDQTVDGWVVFIHDLSEQEHYRLHSKRLEQRALIGDLLLTFAHEVRNPLNNLYVGIQMLQQRGAQLDEAAWQESLQRLLEDTQRLSRLMNDLLAFARPKQGEKRALALDELLRQVVRRMEPRLDKRRIRLEWYCQGDLPLVLGDRYALEQVFVNLLTNAMQALENQPGERFIGLRCRATEQDGQLYVEIAISDNGPGIPPEIRDKIFKPFFSTRPDGTGLGLAIAHNIVTDHRGHMPLPETFPGGTIFRVRLPAMASKTAEERSFLPALWQEPSPSPSEEATA
ncbi:MAG: PAS domain S-box protein [Chloroflexi bacterium]|nr:PAS domain S-box protein [Chloroflexota bacterium]